MKPASQPGATELPCFAFEFTLGRPNDRRRTAWAVDGTGPPLVCCAPMKRLAIFLATGALLALAACSSSSSTTTPGSGGSSSGNGTTITMVDFKFTPAAITAANNVSLILVNNGTPTHNFSIEGTPVSVDVQPGQTATLTPPNPPVPPGHYAIFCKFHRGLGMVGTLDVTAG
jgi:plastocyanin